MLGALLLAASTTASSAAFTDEARGRVDVDALRPECASSMTSGPVDHVVSVGQFLNGWGVWATGPWLCSPSGSWIAGMQVDGNLVAYDMRATPGTPLWNSWTYGGYFAGQGAALILRANGELVVVDAAGNRLRSSGTEGVPTPVTVALDDAGTLTVTDAAGAVRFTTQGLQDVDCKGWPYLACDPNSPMQT